MRLYLRIVSESLLLALAALKANRLRTSLSLAGITIGIFTIISVFTLVDTIEAYIKDSISELGDNIIFVQKWPWQFSGEYKWWDYLKRPQPSLDDFEYLQRYSQIVYGSAYVVGFQAKIEYDKSSLEGAIVEASTADYDKVRSMKIDRGRYFTVGEFESGYPGVILGDQIAQDLFGSFPYLGKTIRIKGRKARVIGKFEKQGESMIDFSWDDRVLIPLNFSRKIVDITNPNINPTIFVSSKPGYTNDDLKEELVGLMRNSRKLKPRDENNFALNETSIVTQGLESFFDVIHTLGLIIGGFSVVVGGFSIANIMFVSVKERTKIIGIQKSLGAKNVFILSQYLGESVFLSLIGGIIGLLLIGILGISITSFTDYSVEITLKNILIGILISISVGVVSGIIPAWIASRKDPVEAIRS